MTESTQSLPAEYDSTLLQWILTTVAGRWLDSVVQAWRVARLLLSRQVHEGMYEILDYESVLELKDRQGKVALLKRRQKVRFLQSNIMAYQDEAWGDGQLFATYRCSPGVPVDRYRDGLKWKVLISLRETKQRGDVTEFNLSRRIKNGFSESNEWLQTELSHRTRHLRISIIFPRQRPCQRALLVERNRSRSTELGPAHTVLLADGRQVLAWETDRPSIGELYTIKWQW